MPLGDVRLAIISIIFSFLNGIFFLLFLFLLLRCCCQLSFQIVRPVSGIIVVDVQNDFISGTLAISNCMAKQVMEWKLYFF